MATPKIIADFETQLATALSIGSTSFTLTSATDDDGVALPTGKYYFTIDNASTQKEYVVGTLTGTSVASVSNVSRQGSETSGCTRAHRIGASVIMTDFMTYKNYIDETTTAGAPDASDTNKGVVEMATLTEVRARTGTGSTLAKLAVSPDVLSDLPTQAEKEALAGGGNFGTPSTSNKFITEAYNASASGIAQIVPFTASGTWTKDAGLKYVIVEVVGGGGGGGGSFNTTNDRNGNGGGGGGYSRKIIAAASLGATETVTVGAGGTAGPGAAVGLGGTGGTSSFGSHCQATGGTGGDSGSQAEAGAGGVGSGGTINTSGGPGSLAGYVSGSNDTYSGNGGSSYMGGGAKGWDVSASAQQGVAGGNYGGGGSGARGSSNELGGAGAGGIVIVTEYYS